MKYDYSKLLGKITEKYGNNGNFAAKMGLSEKTISLKLNNKTDFKQDEIIKASKLLDISPTDLHIYFFTEKVKKTQ